MRAGPVDGQTPRVRRAHPLSWPSARRISWLTVLLAAATLVAAGPARRAAAQDARGWATSAVQYAELRPLRVDTVPLAQAVETSPGAYAIDGERVECILGVGCLRWLPAPLASAAVGTQDLELTGWGFGVTGLSATFSARARHRLGGELAWPLSDDAFDLNLGYVELSRGLVRGRLGRQESLSGLGSAAFDGADVMAVAARGVRLEAYGGRSLARGLREPRDEALRGLQDFLLDQSAYLVGGALAYAGRAPVTGELRYQREIWSDRSGLISERASLDASSARFAPLAVAASLDYDFGLGRLGKGQIQLRRPLGAGSGSAMEVTARRYLPYFELYTIWGFFSPVAYHELELRGSWGRTNAALWASGAYRAYEDAGASAFLEAPSSSGWRVAGGGEWRPRPDWTAQARLSAELMPGAFVSSADGSLTVRVHPRLSLTAGATGFQQVEEYRLSDGRVVGGTLAVDLAISDRMRLDAGGAVYRQWDGKRDAAFDWSQRRAWSSLRVEVGRDPGLAGRAP